MLKICLLGLIAAVLTVIGVGYWVSMPMFDEVRPRFEPEIANPAQALTFARTATSLIRVTSHLGDRVTGVDLTATLGPAQTEDLITLVNRLDFDALLSIEEPTVTEPLDQLIAPLAYTPPALAAGTNFKAHADEIYSDDPPFVFPKLAASGTWRDDVPITARLDYEAELAVFPLADIRSPDVLPRFGLVLANDFTDRWTLIRELDLSRPMGETGFAAAKGCLGCLPTGYLVVIPRSGEFYKTLDVSLYLNDALRQRFPIDALIMPIEDIVRTAFDQDVVPYQKGESTVSLLPHGSIPRGTLILLGTGAGVLFKPLNLWNADFYLQPGDVVRTEARYLGHLENRIR